MKKILTLFMAIMLISSIVSINAMAMEQAMTLTITDTVVDAGATSAVVTVEVAADAYPLNLAFLEFDVVADEGIALSAETASVAALGQTSLVYDSTTSNGNYVNITDDNGADVEAESATSFKLVFDIENAVAGNEYAITLAAVAAQDYEDWDDVEITVVPGKIVVKGEEEKVVMTAEPFITEVATSEEKDGWQAGQAVALQFATADLADFIAMNWKLTVADVNKFAKVDDAAFATIKATAAETVDVFASFIVNTAENKTATPITAVSAGFLKADGTVVEAE